MRTIFIIVAIFAAARGAFAANTGSGAVQPVLDRWISAQGGRARLATIRTYELQETIQFMPGGPAIDSRAIRTNEGHFRYEISSAGASAVIQAWDGLIGWEGNESLGFGLIPRGEMPGLIGQDNLLIGLNLDRIYPKRRMLGDGEAGGHPCAVVGLVGPDGIEEKCYFDKVSGQCVRDERPDVAHPGKWLTSDFSDFREVDGLTFPSVIRASGGGGAATFRRTKLIVNPPLDEAVFMISTARLEEIGRIDSILRRNLAAVGGADAISRIHSRVTKVLIGSPDSAQITRETISQKAPAFVLNEYDTPGLGRRWEGFDGTSGWIRGEIDGFRLLKPEEIVAWNNHARLADDGRLAGRYPLGRILGTFLVNGRATHAILLSRLQFSVGTFYFDDENGRLLRMATIFGNSDGHYEATQDYSDFRKADGVEKPYRITETDPRGQSVETVVSIADNVPLDDAIFKPRRDDW